ncbi:putative bifunctional diguanylate cyclase/phosphodiesterase [Methylocystis heyeri]|uniref:EAL domain-containing protein n=1 Tax=Methylocystis heyeri TaxID=391905 RepID=A0A6B8KD14_9HYPH|nr:bifunctional diguanylate cyclase/phosphodiesterase [Methylocystis heyeri]QGM44313.1 EAL domain-containing protein [Methylocystis heyeri]
MDNEGADFIGGAKTLLQSGVAAMGLTAFVTLLLLVGELFWPAQGEPSRAAVLLGAISGVCLLFYLARSKAAPRERGPALGRFRHRSSYESPAVPAPAGRQEFEHRLAELKVKARADRQRLAVVVIKLDALTAVEEKFRSEVKEYVELAASQRLETCVRAEDCVTRIGDQKFGIILLEAPEISAVADLTERILEAFSVPFRVLGHTLSAAAGARAGIAIMNDLEGADQDLLACAEAALAQAERHDRLRLCIYSSDMEERQKERRQLELELGDEIRNGDGLYLSYQPSFDPSGEVMLGVEALCRWRHPVRGEVPPTIFIPLAENSGLIHLLGEWVLRNACRQATEWPELKVAVNVSPQQFKRIGFVDLVRRVLGETGLDPRQLEIELTESILVNDLQTAEAQLAELKKIGVRLALDDFGTGYSSLSYLLALPFDRLKIDRSFVTRVQSSARGAAVVHSIISLGRALGMQVTAEGVDTPEQHKFLRVAGVHAFQGYLFSRPVEAGEISERLAAQKAARRPS